MKTLWLWLLLTQTLTGGHDLGQLASRHLGLVTLARVVN